MNLEDHAGDILSKSRDATGLALSDLAKRLGITEKILSDFEQSGTAPALLDLHQAGIAAGLDGAKLRRVAQGWLPASPDLTQWRELRRFTTNAEGISVHCYLIWDEVSREAALFDTGWDAEPILREIAAENLTLKHIFLTHSHPDHLGGLEKIRAQFPKALLHTSSKNAPPQHRNRANDFIHLGSLRISNRETPGHSEDGVTYVIGNWPEDAPFVAIVGDAIFAASMGRGHVSWETARQKIKEQIFSLPPSTLLCPGHGPFTSVAEEKENNPFF